MKKIPRKFSADLKIKAVLEAFKEQMTKQELSSKCAIGTVPPDERYFKPIIGRVTQLRKS